MDETLYSRLKLLLSFESPVCDSMVQEAALKSMAVLVRKSVYLHYVSSILFIGSSFPEIALDMASHLRRFVTSPLSIFEFEFASSTRTPPPLAAAAKSLALCIDVSIFERNITFYRPLTCSNSWRPAKISLCLTCIRCSIILPQLAKMRMTTVLSHPCPSTR